MTFAVVVAVGWIVLSVVTGLILGGVIARREQRGPARLTVVARRRTGPASEANRTPVTPYRTLRQG